MTFAQRFEQKGLEKGLQQGIQQGLQQGMQQGLQQGMQQERLTLARKLLAKGLALEEVKELTDLSMVTLQQLRKQ